MVIDVCVGSSCHLKGSYDVIQKLQGLVKERGLEDKITIKASFCLGNCADGVSVMLDGELLKCVTPENVENIFNDEIMKRI